MQVTQLKFTQEELEVLENNQFFRVKLSAIKKIMEMFGKLESELKLQCDGSDFSFDNEINISQGKIFRGENYLNLPYVVLDYPRLFNTQSVFAFRTMFWWANFFSFTMHLQGKAWEKHKQSVHRNLHLLLNADYYICVNDTPWQYHFGADNYMKLEDFISDQRGDQVMKMSFFKISKKLQIQDYELLVNTGIKSISDYIKLLK